MNNTPTTAAELKKLDRRIELATVAYFALPWRHPAEREYQRRITTLEKQRAKLITRTKKQ